jgi:hypothetical protein
LTSPTCRFNKTRSDAPLNRPHAPSLNTSSHHAMHPGHTVRLQIYTNTSSTSSITDMCGVLQVHLFNNFDV